MYQVFWTWNKSSDEWDPITAPVDNIFDAVLSVQTDKQEGFNHFFFQAVALPPASDHEANY